MHDIRSRSWVLTFGLAALVVVGAALASTVSPTGGADAAAATADAMADPCFKYGRFECCVRPDEK